MTSIYHVHFTRYRNHNRRVSAMEPISATDFEDATSQAGLMLRGMRLADPDAEFDIVEIINSGINRSKLSPHGFMSDDEWTAYVAKQSPAG